MTSDQELAKILLHCNSVPEHFSTLPQNLQQDVKHYCNEIIKYGGIAHQLPGGKFFTDNTLLKPAKTLVKSLRRKKGEEEDLESKTDF